MNLILETPRLILREMRHEDANALFEMDCNPNVHKYLWQKPVVNIDEVHAYIDMVRQQYMDNGIGRFVAITKDTNELIGWTGIKFVNDHVENGNTNFYDYGYRLNEKFWNKGFATESAKACIDYGFENLNLKTIIGRAISENIASIKVLEKIGLKFEREFDFELLSELMFDRFQRGQNKLIRTGINRAVEIIDEISDEALLGLTAYFVYSNIVVNSSSVETSLNILNNLFKKIVYDKYCYSNGWSRKPLCKSRL